MTLEYHKTIHKMNIIICRFLLVMFMFTDNLEREGETMNNKNKSINQSVRYRREIFLKGKYLFKHFLEIYNEEYQSLAVVYHITCLGNIWVILIIISEIYLLYFNFY